MTIAEPLASAEDKLLESEIGRNIPKLPRTGASFRQTESGDDEPSAKNLDNLLRQVSKLSILKLTISLVSFKRSGKSYRPMAIALNGTLRNTWN
jgi:hypothetical protein